MGKKHGSQINVRVVGFRARHQTVIRSQRAHVGLVVATADVGISEPRRVGHDHIKHAVHEDRLVQVLQHKAPNTVAVVELGMAHGLVHRVKLAGVGGCQVNSCHAVSQGLFKKLRGLLDRQLLIYKVLSQVYGF